MSELEKSFRELSKTENVFLFVPNLIGYGRIFLALLRYTAITINAPFEVNCFVSKCTLLQILQFAFSKCVHVQNCLLGTAVFLI